MSTPVTDRIKKLTGLSVLLDSLLAWHRSQHSAGGLPLVDKSRHATFIAELNAAKQIVESERTSLVVAIEKIRLSAAVLPNELQGLPQELLDELSINNDSDKLDYTILSAVESAGGVMSLDQILIAAYRSTGIVHKRKAITARLYRMTQRQLLYSVEGRKGLYTTNQQLAESPPKDETPTIKKIGNLMFPTTAPETTGQLARLAIQAAEGLSQAPDTYDEEAQS